MQQAHLADVTAPHFDPFFNALAALLQSCGPDRPMPLSRIASTGRVQAEWITLLRTRTIDKSVKMKEVILRRPRTFQIILDHLNMPHVRLVRTSMPSAVLEAAAAIQQATQGKVGGFSDAVDAHEHALMNACSLDSVLAPGHGTAAVAGEVSTLCPAASVITSKPGTLLSSTGLRPEQLSAIRAHLSKNNGHERMSKIGGQFGVKQAQLRPHFTLVPCGADPIVVLGRAGEVNVNDVARNAMGLVAEKAPLSLVLARSATPGTAGGAIFALEQLLRRLVPSRGSVQEAMVHCLDNSQHAAALARRLAASLGEAGLSVDTALARLFVVSDILSNSNTDRPGASRYISGFREQLPEAFEQLGREWFRRIEGHVERNRAERKLRAVLAVWRDLRTFPPLFVRGLEALAFAPVLDGPSSNPDTETDELLRRKLTRWFFAADQARLPYACQLRGLAGRLLATAVCRARLCHFERYWHIPGVDLPEDPDLFGDELPTTGPSRMTASSGDQGTSAEQCAGEGAMEEEGSCDGEPLSIDELIEIEALEAQGIDVEFLGLRPGTMTVI